MKATYQVVVGNIGTVCATKDEHNAKMTFFAYTDQSVSQYGRAAGEDVTLFKDGYIIAEHFGTVEPN